MPARTRSGAAGFDGTEPTLRAQFEAAGLREVETATKTLLVPYASLDACFGPIERD
jgi:hypothetical protein